jgi:hypothetical protein
MVGATSLASVLAFGGEIPCRQVNLTTAARPRRIDPTREKEKSPRFADSFHPLDTIVLHVITPYAKRFAGRPADSLTLIAVQLFLRSTILVRQVKRTSVETALRSF